MENEAKQRNQRNRRRERAQQMQQQKEKQGDPGSGDEGDDSPVRGTRERSRPRKRRGNSNPFDEDIIDGFAILSFKTYEELEIVIKSMEKNNGKNPELPLKRSQGLCSLPKKKRIIPKKSLKIHDLSNSTDINENRPCDETTNGLSRPPRSCSRDRLSDDGSASSHSSSGGGYICDSESEDDHDRASDAGSDFLTSSSHKSASETTTTTTTSAPTITTTTVSSNSSPLPHPVQQNGPREPIPPLPPTIPSLSGSREVEKSESEKENINSTSTVSPYTKGSSWISTSTSSISINISSSNNHITHSNHSNHSSHSVHSTHNSHSTHSSHSSHSSHSGHNNNSCNTSISNSNPNPILTSNIINSSSTGISSSNSTSTIYSHPNPHISPTPNPSISLSLHTSHHTPTFTHPPPPALHPHTSHHSMFASPIPPPPLTSPALQIPGAGPSPFGSESTLTPAYQDLLRRELDSRFLATHDRTATIPPPYMRTEMHQHQHQHQHTHMHQHSHSLNLPPPLGSSLVPTPAPHLLDPMESSLQLIGLSRFEKYSKLDTSFYRQSLGLPTYPALSPIVPPAAAAATSLAPPNHLGAFQPKKSGKWCAMHVRIAWEIYNHQQKQQAELHKESAGKSDLLRPPNHIFNLHRPHEMGLPTALLGPANSKRTPNAESLNCLWFPLQSNSKGAHSRTPFESGPHHNTFISSNPGLAPGVSPFSRPSYAGFGTPGNPFPGLSLGNTGSIFGRSDIPGLGLTPATHDQWSRLHRTPSSFPTPPAWPLKSDVERDRERERGREREREKEREKTPVVDLDRERRDKEIEKNKELERVITSWDRLPDSLVRAESIAMLKKREQERQALKELEREKQKERDRENRTICRASPASDISDRRTNIDLDRSRERERPDAIHERRESSRSPLRTSKDERRDLLTKSDSAFDNVLNHTSKSDNVKVKEERKDDDIMIVGGADRDRNRIRNDYYPSTTLLPPPPAINIGLLDRSRMIGPFGIPERLQHPPPLMWNVRDPYNMDLVRRHQLEMQREIEREQMLRFNPLGPMIDHEQRYREREPHDFSRDRLIDPGRRELERALLLDRERAEFDRTKIPPLRATDNMFIPPTPPNLYQRSVSPLTNHNPRSKSNSPSNSAGVPPPLIPSALTNNHQNHTGVRSGGNSPAVNKQNGTSPLENTHEQITKDKKEATANSMEEAQSR